jgi:predicted esterase
MNSTEKDIEYSSRKTYSTLNKLTSKTKNIWFVCHGIGYLSRSFIQYFRLLNPEENYIIAPQAPSKYYIGHDYIRVGSCWLTKENTDMEIENVLNYLDAVYIAENIPGKINFLVVGYSQGVSVAARWIARRKIKCTKMILYAGGIPIELKQEDCTFLKTNKTNVICIYGNKDPYFNASKLEQEKLKLRELFGSQLKIHLFDGGHEFRVDLINRWIGLEY